MKEKQKLALLSELLEKLASVVCVNHFDFTIMGLLLMVSKDKEIGSVLAKPEVAKQWFALCKAKNHELASGAVAKRSGDVSYLISFMSTPVIINTRETTQYRLMAAIIVLLVDITELRITFSIATQKCYDVLAGKDEYKNPYLTEWMSGK